MFEIIAVGIRLDGECASKEANKQYTYDRPHLVTDD